MLGIEELEELLDEIRIKVTIANRDGSLPDLLKKLGIENTIQQPSPRFESYRSGKIVVIGENTVKESVLKKIAEDLGLDKNRFEFCLDYSEAQKYPYKKLQYSEKYRVVLVGAVPHSANCKGDSGSIIAEMENGDGYPRVERLCSSNELKITKSNFRETLQRLIDENYI